MGRVDQVEDQIECKKEPELVLVMERLLRRVIELGGN